VPEIVSLPNAIAVPRPIAQGFVFDNVGYRYAETESRHEQLVAQGGRYAELFELQAAGYR
jgi:ATP-binding cassette, subfamily B, bacterial